MKRQLLVILCGLAALWLAVWVTYLALVRI